jgi:hypothetical protein
MTHDHKYCIAQKIYYGVTSKAKPGVASKAKIAKIGVTSEAPPQSSRSLSKR